MPQNGINHPGVTALAQAFAINPLLRVINLNDNTFTEKGAVAMAKVRRARKAESGCCLCSLPIGRCLLCPSPCLRGVPPMGPAHANMSRTGHISPAPLCPPWAALSVCAALILSCPSRWCWFCSQRLHGRPLQPDCYPRRVFHQLLVEPLSSAQPCTECRPCRVESKPLLSRSP